MAEGGGSSIGEESISVLRVHLLVPHDIVWVTMTAPGWASLLSSHRIIVHTMGPPPRSTTSRRNRVAFRILVWIALLLAAYQVLWTWYLAGVNIPDVEIDPLTGQQKVRRRPDRLRKYDPEQGKGVAT